MAGMPGRNEAEVTIRAARVDDEVTLGLLAARLADFELPRWRAGEDIAMADARAMMASVGTAHPDDEVLIAERGGRAVGCLHLVTATDFFGLHHAHVSVLAVTAAAEGTGVGRFLIAHAERWARARGLALLTLSVFAANGRARRLYERAGFAPEVMKYAKPLA